MARKKKNQTSDKPKELTRKQQHVSAHDRERNQRVLIGTGIAIGLALLFVVIGVVYEYAYKPSSALATVGENKIATGDYWKRVRLTQSQLENQLEQYVNLERQFGNQGYFTSQIEQIQQLLYDPQSLGQQVLEEMIQEEVVEQEAIARGVSVSDGEVDEAVREQVAASMRALTVAQATATADAQAEATATAASWTPTPEPTIDVNSAITDTEEAPTEEPLPTLPILNDTTYSEGLSEMESNIKEISGMSLAEYRKVISAGLLQDKLQEAMGDELVNLFTEEVNARHILLEIRESESPLEGMETVEIEGLPTPAASSSVTDTTVFTVEDLADAPRSEEETLALAEELRQRIIDGEDFATLAEAFSDDPGSAASGGDLGWFGRGRMVPAFEAAAFALGIGDVSMPVKSDFGYHIIQVVDREDQRPKDEATLNQERQQVFSEWLTTKSLEADIERPENILDSLPSDLDLTPLRAPAQ